MKRILFKKQFVNTTDNDLVAGKIHTIRANYDYWKRFEGQDVALAYWIGKPYRSKQKTFCTKKIISVERIKKFATLRTNQIFFATWEAQDLPREVRISGLNLSRNDGFRCHEDFFAWFEKYPNQPMAVIHFTDFRYDRGIQ